MVKKKAVDATVEEILNDLIHWEDHEQSLLIATEEDGGIVVLDQEWKTTGEGKTLKEALINFVRSDINSCEGCELDYE